MAPLLIKLDPEGLYARLGVEPSAPHDEITAAFRRKARILHPDIAGTGNNDAFVAVKQAYDVLVNPARRSAYDRAARQAMLEAVQPGEILPTAPPPGPEIRPRQPRFADLPLGVWAGFGAVLCIGLVQVVLHLSALPPPVHPSDIRPNAPTVAPATPAQSRALASGPPPVALPGSPNFYVVPAAGPTVLWHHDTEHKDYVPIRTMPPFSSVQALRLVRPNGMVEVRVTDTATGFIQASRLAPGDATAAHRGWCGYNAGATPSDGEVLERHGSGPGRIELDNHTSQPAVVKLRDTSGAVVASVFLGPGGHAELGGLPKGLYRPDYAIGEFWSRACNSFAAGMRAQRFAAYYPLDALKAMAIPPELPSDASPVDIPDQAFEQD